MTWRSSSVASCRNPGVFANQLKKMGGTTDYLITILLIYDWLPYILWLIIHRGDPGPDDRVGPNRIINNIRYAVQASVAIITLSSYQEELLSLRYGPLALLPAMQIAIGLYYNNVAAVPPPRKAKL